jgi:hypothetical protein
VFELEPQLKTINESAATTKRAFMSVLPKEDRSLRTVQGGAK